MDPDANLIEQRELAARILAAADAADLETGDWRPDPEDAHRLAELSAALDLWLRRGGALPSDWLRERTAAMEAEQRADATPEMEADR
jgi:hypothetical protein